MADIMYEQRAWQMKQILLLHTFITELRTVYVKCVKLIMTAWRAISHPFDHVVAVRYKTDVAELSTLNDET